jgi:hypothetical protein
MVADILQIKEALNLFSHAFWFNVSSPNTWTLPLFQMVYYKGESIIIHNAVAFVCLLAAQSFSRSSLGGVSFLSLLHKFEVARSVPLLQL